MLFKAHDRRARFKTSCHSPDVWLWASSFLSLHIPIEAMIYGQAILRSTKCYENKSLLQSPKGQSKEGDCITETKTFILFINS